MLIVFWLVITALLCGGALALQQWLAYVVAGCLVIAFAAWVLACVLSPAVPDRTCPRCGGAGLVKVVRRSPGVRCELCGFADESMHVAYLDEW